MNELVKKFFEEEKEKDFIVENLPNGVRYRSKKDIQWNIMHESYKPLTDEQIAFLQDEVNAFKRTHYIFPEWFHDFLKTSNGCNLFYDSLSIYGEQTPLLNKAGEKEYAKLDRTNPDWMAPYNLRTDGLKMDPASAERWFVFGSYSYDGTELAWDYKRKKIVAMYELPDTMSIKEKRKVKEADYEKMICAEWDSFDEFFLNETKRLEEVILKYGEEVDVQSLPVGHKDWEE